MAESQQAPIAHKGKLMFLDVDGTLTDGVIGLSKDGDRRSFWVRDGVPLERSRGLGLPPALLPGR